MGERRGEVYRGLWWVNVRERECLADCGEAMLILILRSWTGGEWSNR